MEEPEVRSPVSYPKEEGPEERLGGIHLLGREVEEGLRHGRKRGIRYRSQD